MCRNGGGEGKASTLEGEGTGLDERLASCATHSVVGKEEEADKLSGKQRGESTLRSGGKGEGRD